MSAPAAPLPVRGGRLAKAAAYVELGKLRIVELWFGVPLAWSLLPVGQRTVASTWGVLAAAVLVEMGTTSASLALDDVAGYRDGVDAANHADTDRYGVNKPLLDGRLSERESLRFAWSAVAVAVVALLAALALAPTIPWWEPLLGFGTILLALNYSYGVRLSYIGGCEAVTLLAMVATVIFPFGLLHGGLSPVAAVEAALLGMWMLQVSLFSNTQDAAGDREANRLTLAARVRLDLNLRIIVATFAVSFAVAMTALALGTLPLAAVGLLAPSWALQAAQLNVGVRRAGWLRARALGFMAFRLGVGGLLIANLIAH
jgi:1,4-dihydroxy-2-naphthoate octaprenyltransferase